MNVFSLRNVAYSYDRGSPVLRDISLDFKAGERTVILGANGTGKSTLLAMLDGLVFPRTGSIQVFGESLSEEALEDRTFSMDFRKRVAFVFQNPDVQLFSPTVWDEVAFGPLQLGFVAVAGHGQSGGTARVAAHPGPSRPGAVSAFRRPEKEGGHCIKPGNGP